jgi:hypothetical protein
MYYDIDTQKALASKFEKLIEFHKKNIDSVHAYSFLVLIDDKLITVNDFSEKEFEQRFKACLRNEWYPFFLYHKRKHLNPIEHVDFIHTFEERMTKRGKKPSLKLTYRDSMRDLKNLESLVTS